MKKFLIIFAVALAVGSISQVYAQRETIITVRLFGYGGGTGGTGGGSSGSITAAVCPNPSRDVCAEVVIRRFDSLSTDHCFGGVSAVSQGFVQEVDVTPIFLDSDRVLLMNSATGELIEGEILEVRIFDAAMINVVPDELPSLINPTRVRPGSMVLTTE